MSGEEPGAMLEMQQSIHQKISKNLHFFIEKSFINDPDAEKHFEDFKKYYWKSRAVDILKGRCK
nr:MULTISPECIES: HNH/ENDO VII family nuclease [unclassified Acidovorax]